MVAGEIDPRSGYESCQFGQKLQRLEDKVGGSVAKGAFECIDNTSIRLAGQAIKGQRAPRNVTTEPFKTVPLVGLAGNGCV